MRLCTDVMDGVLVPRKVSDKLTGFFHNGVSPFGMKEDIPVRMSIFIPAGCVI